MWIRRNRGCLLYLYKCAGAGTSYTCRKNELHMTGGSDYHGTPKPDIQLGTGLGNLYVPDAFANWLLA